MALQLALQGKSKESLQQCEQKVAGLLQAAQLEGLDLRRGQSRVHSPGADVARQCLMAFGNELELVRSELSETARSVSPRRPASGADIAMDMDAAKLQRELGKVLAAERETYCQLVEARFHVGELNPLGSLAATSDAHSIENLRQRVEQLTRDLHQKDAESERLRKSASKGPN